MKLIRKLTVILAVLLISTAFVGAGSAFTYSSNDAVITPAGSLSAGQSVTATMKITITGGSLDVSDKLTLSTPLTDTKWSTDIYRGGVVIVSDYESCSISGFMLESYADLVLQISLSGTVAAASEGEEISVLTISATDKETNGYSHFATKKQMVYDSDNFATDLTASNNDVETLKSRVATYVGYGIDVGSVSQSISQAETNLAAAATAGVANLVTAYANIEAADTLLAKAERDLAYAGLTSVNTNMGKITSITATLYSRGWGSDAQYLETKTIAMQYTYESLAATYNAGGVPDAVKTDTLVADSFKTLEKANDYLESSEGIPNSLTLQSGWNFVSIPKALSAGTASASTLFGSVDTAENAVLAYNASAQSWEQVTASAVIKPLTGYWIYSNGTVDVPLSYVTDPSVPAVKQLYSGWNAVGVSAETAVSASSFLAGTPWRVALPWDLEAGNWNIAVVNGGSSENSAEQYLSLGNGIWVYAESDGTLIGLTA